MQSTEIEPTEYYPSNATRINKSTTPLGVDGKAYAALMANSIGVTLTEFAMFEGMTTAEINKVLFSLSKTQSEQRAKDISDANLSTLSLMGNTRIESMLATAKNRRAHTAGNVASLTEQLSEALSKLGAYNRDIRALERGEGVNYAAQVREVIADGWYKLHDVTPNYIRFTTPDVICKHINTEAGINTEVNLGKYMVKVKPEAARIYVEEFDSNTKVEGYIHPHISGNAVCWGNAHSAYKKLAEEFTFVPALTALRSLLQAYNPDSPYRTLVKFKAKQEESVMLQDKAGDTYLRPEQITNRVILRVRMPYSGNLEDLVNLPQIYSSSERYFIEGVSDHDGNTYVTAGDGSYYSAVGTIGYGYYGVLSEEHTMQSYIKQTFKYCYKLNMDELRTLSEAYQAEIFDNDPMVDASYGELFEEVLDVTV